MRPRHGFTLLDQLLAITIMGTLLAVGVQQAGALRDTLALRAAHHAVAEAFALARDHASAAGVRPAVRFGRTDARVAVHNGADTLWSASTMALYGVSLEASRDSMAYLPSGLGYGAANMRVVLSRGQQQDTIAVSRLGRVR